MKIKHQVRAWIILILILGIFVVASFFIPGLRNFSSPTYVRDFLLGLKLFGHFIYVLLFIASIPLPIPSSPLALGGGYVFGFWLGTLLALIGLVIGASISFLLVRKFGTPLVEKLIEKRHIVHLNHIFKKRGVAAVLIAYAIPIFPSDALDFILGLTKIKYSTFLWIILIGNIPRYLLINSLGHDLYHGFTWKTVFILFGIMAMIVIAIEREKIKRIIFTELQVLEREIKEIEEEVGEEMNKLEKRVE